MDPDLPFERVSPTFVAFVMFFDVSAKTENDGFGSCSWKLWNLPEWTIVIATSTYLSVTAVNLAEYTGMNNGAQAAWNTTCLT